MDCPKCGGSYSPEEYIPGVCRHCLPPIVPALPGKTLCAECESDEQICPECGYPVGS